MPLLFVELALGLPLSVFSALLHFSHSPLAVILWDFGKKAMFSFGYGVGEKIKSLFSF